MTKQIDMSQKTTPSGERCRSALSRTVTTFCHLFRGLHTADRRRFLRRSASSRATSTRHCLLNAPHTDEC
jgi:hypothetical protein